jgi:hypothetical protein
MGAARGLIPETIVFRVTDRDEPALEVRVNFGVFAGRQATPAEIDDLARSLNEVTGAFAILAEERHEFRGEVEAAVRQVVIEVGPDEAGPDPDVLCDRVVARAERWAAECIQTRADLGELGSEL